MLSHIYFLISNHKEVELTTLSQHFLLEVNIIIFIAVNEVNIT